MACHPYYLGFNPRGEACKFDQMVISIVVVSLVYNVNLFITKNCFHVFVALIIKKHFFTTI